MTVSSFDRASSGFLHVSCSLAVVSVSVSLFSCCLAVVFARVVVNLLSSSLDRSLVLWFSRSWDAMPGCSWGTKLVRGRRFNADGEA